MESFSQIGQDLWVLETLKNKRNGYFLDIGAHDGIYISNTYLLEKKYDWNGLCLDGNSLILEDLKKNRKCKCIYALLDKEEKECYFFTNTQNKNMGVFSRILDNREGKILENNLKIDNDKNIKLSKIKTSLISNILIENNVPKEIDYMSVDIEGKEIDLLETFPFHEYKVKCITVEHNAPHEGNTRQNKIREILTNNGYRFVKGNDDVNNWGHGPIDDYYVLCEDHLIQSNNTKFITNNVISKNTSDTSNTNNINIKIGILVKKFQSLFNCGISQQSYFTYKVLKNAGFDVELYTAEDNYDKFELTNTPIKKLTYDSNLSHLSMIIFISSSVSSRKELEFIKSFDIKIVNQVCGNYYLITQEDIIHNCFKRDFYSNCDLIDEYWILPMYDHMKSYLETMTKRPVYIMNYVWDSDIVDFYMNQENKNAFCDPSLKFKDNINIFIAEPNLSIHKTCLIPMCIAEKYEYLHGNISKAYLMCKNRNDMFKKVIGDLDIVKKNKVEMHHRMILFDVLDQLRTKKSPTVLISHQINNDLNFLHLEMMYLQYPIVHNCPRLKDFGYYYNEHNVEEGYNSLKNVNDNFDNDRCDYSAILWKYNPKNKENVDFYKKEINRVLKDCIKNNHVNQVNYVNQVNQVNNDINHDNHINKDINKEKEKSNVELQPSESVPEEDIAHNMLDDIINQYLDCPITNINDVNKLSDLEGEGENRDNVFTNIYKNSDSNSNVWNNDGETKSGPGSTLDNTAYTRFELKNIIKKYGIKSILDIGCGDFHWMNLVIKKNKKLIQKYIGIDIVEELIQENKEKYLNDSNNNLIENLEFNVGDITKIDLSNYNEDLVLCKEVLIHLSYQDSFNFFKNLKKSKCKYLLTTYFGDVSNKNIDRGEVYNINLLGYPFNFPKPTYLIDERGTLQRFDNSKRDIPQYMGLWEIKDIPDFD